MQVLAIDCAQRFCSAAVYDADLARVLAMASPDIGRGHAERLPGIVDEVIAAAGASLRDINRIAVTIGPGSFAGIRVGVAFARGLALALGVPAVGISTLAALGEPVAGRLARPVLVALDAKRDRLWSAVVAPGGGFLEAPSEIDPATAAELIAATGYPLVGNAGAVLRDSFPDFFASAAVEEHVADAPDVADLARIGATLVAAENPAEPVYLRAADAKPQAGFAIARTRR